MESCPWLYRPTSLHYNAYKVKFLGYVIVYCLLSIVFSPFRSREEEDKPPDISKGKATTVNSVVYHNARFDGGDLSPANEKQLVQSLLSAAEKGDEDAVKAILSKSPLIINRTDSDGYTALHRACYSGHEAMVALLMERGSNIHSSTDDGWQPLHCAVRWSKL